MDNPSAAAVREQILSLVRNYHALAFPDRPFEPGTTQIPVSGKVFDSEELSSLVDSSLDFWLTTGRYAEAFELAFAPIMGVRHAALCNSGSSANLLAASALTSPRLGDRRLVPGDEVITTAAGFPTTVNPIVQNGLVPVFVDVDLRTLDADGDALRAAVGPRTRAIMMAHTLGNPFDVDLVLELAAAHDLWVVEDSCDAVGSTFRGQPAGSFGDLATVSFYPAHHITMGEGGAVLTQKGSLRKIVESFRDWGRDCWCLPGMDNTCGRRFDWELGGLPYGYDHKYVYSHIGYNLKATDMQASVGLAQLGKLPGFIEARRRNWQRLREGMADLDHLFILPEATPHSDPSWFGFALTVRSEAPFSRFDMVRHLEDNKIATRLVFAGNLVRQPAYEGVPHRIVDTLTNSDIIADDAFWVGVYPGITDASIDYVLDVVHRFVAAPSAATRGRARLVVSDRFTDGPT